MLKAKWESKGWTMLGQRVVQGGKDHDLIRVGAKQGKFTRLMLVVEGSELEMHDVKITFGNGETMDPNVRHFFKENSLTRQIDLPGNERFIRSIEFKYGNLPGGGRAKVQVWAKEGDAGPGPGPGPVVGGGGGVLKPRWDPAGWVKLGSRVVQGKTDRDIIPVGKVAGNFNRLMVVVEGSELEMNDMNVEFGNGQKWSPKVRHFFRERSATRAIDLPGAQRFIKKIEFIYGNLPGGGKSTVTVWAHDPDRWRGARMSEAEKWWRLRQKELAKAAADREKWLLAQEELLSRERQARREARRAEILARWEASLLGQQQALSELNRHAERLARLNRALRLAEAAGNGKLAVRVRVLIDLERARHDMNMMALRAP
ncbi:MAG TPA: hypothetical protein VFU21_24880 [Kofleriaceae bacterium]|nr:hypothetical protein [Kofleriaceae bacterium]